MQVPVWDDTRIKFALMSEGDEWRQRAFVKITDSVTHKALARAHDRMSNVQYLCVLMHGVDLSAPIFTLLEKAAMPNLRALHIDLYVGDELALFVENALRNNLQVEQVQLKLELHEMSEQTTISLFDTISLLPLTALCLTFWGYLSQQSIHRFCTLLQQKQETLVSLELWSISDNLGFMNALLSKGLCGLHHLRMLRLQCCQLDKLQSTHLSKALECMPYLAKLRITTNDVHALTEFFSTSFRPITACEFCLTGKYPDADLTKMFRALRHNTRLRSLKLNNQQFKCVLESGLAEEGFLTRITHIYTDKNICSVDSLLNNNKSRHAACKRACVALIAVRQKQGVLKWVAPDIIRMIAMWLWDTRSQSAWDAEEPVAKGRKKRQKKKK